MILQILTKEYMGKVKYIRVSSDDQNTGRQRQNADEFSKVYIDKVSGIVQFKDRKEAGKLLRVSVLDLYRKSMYPV